MIGRHGGDWAGYETEYGSLPLDFSANVSPLGLPDGVRERWRMQRAIRIRSAGLCEAGWLSGTVSRQSGSYAETAPQI